MVVDINVNQIMRFHIDNKVFKNTKKITIIKTSTIRGHGNIDL